MRFVLVRYEDETLELLPLYVARDPGGDTALIDTEGERYEDLDDFRRSNGLLGFGDGIMAANHITDVVTVSGRTTPGWVPRLVGAAAVLVPAAAVATAVRVRRRRAQPRLE